jgi:hypothetical protein
MGHPKRGNKAHFEKFHELAAAGDKYPIDEWQKAEPQLKAALLGIRTGS